MRFGRLTGQREVYITPFAYPEQKGAGVFTSNHAGYEYFALSCYRWDDLVLV